MLDQRTVNVTWKPATVRGLHTAREHTVATSPPKFVAWLHWWNCLLTRFTSLPSFPVDPNGHASSNKAIVQEVLDNAADISGIWCPLFPCIKQKLLFRNSSFEPKIPEATVDVR